MQSKSRSSSFTVNSLRTADDVLECLSIREGQHGDVAREDAKRFVDRMCSHDVELAENTVRRE
ncbi:hypothetical protein OnM2_077071 [Erysiphe neolycopersici]|uniref:Uncharacterized protein n=1 Tax=Erysiphe neolycopersici TaxID=212602 RepID=A0A420HHT6_9PEZI|nr:hypothetical protein OnM2_077071 [Erysiphe neolycopersici]